MFSDFFKVFLEVFLLDGAPKLPVISLLRPDEKDDQGKKSPEMKASSRFRLENRSRRRNLSNSRIRQI